MKKKDSLPAKFNFTAIRDFCVIAVEDEKTIGGIVVPDSAKEQVLYGEILSAGCGVIEGGVIIPLVVKAGDHVRFLPHSGTKMKVDGRDVYVLRENQVFGFVPREKE